MSTLKYFNRHTQTLETEQIYKEGFLRWLYEAKLGRVSLSILCRRKIFSWFYGWMMRRSRSRKKILPFVEKYRISTEEMELAVGDFASFDDFFIRELRPEARPIQEEDSVVVFPADGRHFGLQTLSPCQEFFIKNEAWNLNRLFQSEVLAKKFEGGSLVISRLCPVDYHRFHFPYAGLVSTAQVFPGNLYSVHPIALSRLGKKIFWENKRNLTVLQTELLGDIALLEVGATCVGSIVQSFTPYRWVNKGQLKGFFHFGGSCVLTFFEPNRVKLCEDLLKWSSQGTELYAQMGTPMAYLR